MSTTHTYTGVPTSTVYTYAPATGLSATTGSVVSAIPSTNTVYTVTATDINGCFGTTTVSVTRTNLPVDLVASSSSYCVPNGTPVTLTSTGGVSYSYSPIIGLSSGTGSVVTASPASTTQYIVTGIDSTGCWGRDSVLITLVSTTWYLDADGDGYSVGTPVVNCVSPGAGYTTNVLPFGDCNDNNAFVYPGATEICGNGIDENCNGQIDEGCCIPNSGASSYTVCSSYVWVENNNTAYTNSGVYLHTFTNAGGCDSIHTLSLTVNQCNSILNLHLYLQGFYIGSGLMTPVLLNEGAGLSTTETDSINVELRDQLSYSEVASANAMLNTDGTASCTFPALNGSYYIVINHRNNVQTWSASPVAIGALPVSYDFATAANKAYGDNMKEVESGIWAFFGGEINQDENVDLIDLGILEADINDFQFGYISSDVNGDGNVDLLDSPMVEQNINDFIYSNHP
ncbi:hypothetical protein EMGBS15_09640 [Filimonas sp.]|nr:hypothetical protein EMGBS15_09640 [Filimonas sp.]